MSITLFHHPFSRAAGTVWALEEVGVPYTLRFVDLMKGEQKSPELLAMNPMGKLPVLVDGDTVVTEAAAIALYLGDRYASGTLAPALDAPERGTYLRWSFFSPSVVEPGAAGKHSGWEFRPGQVGWGTFEAMLATMHAAVQPGPFLLGDRFSMADVVFGATLRYMVRFGMIESTPVFTAYLDRLAQRPALQRADARNDAIRAEHGLGG
ncbi:MAG: glutathione S-transferase family protein [Nannocystaceae bacterium]|nr:glutathione S-transferase family protein [Nannocystaceae bacterium]